jgi:glutaredoxin
MPKEKGTVTGPRAEHRVAFYGLSTCIWCKRTRQYLEDEGVQFDYTYVDLLTGEEREDAVDTVRKFNPRASFPTVVVDGSECIIGFNKDEIKKVLGL